MAPTGGYSSPPVVGSRSRVRCRALLSCTLGTTLSIVLAALLVLLLPLVLLLRIASFVKKSQPHWKWHFDRRACSHFWPLNGNGVDVLVAVTDNVDDYAAQTIQNRISLCQDEQHVSADTETTGNYRYREIHNLRDLQSALNDSTFLPNNKAVFQLYKQYAGNLCALITTVLTRNVSGCTYKLYTTLVNGGAMFCGSFELEPRLIYYHNRFTTFIEAKLLNFFKFVVSGPCTLLALATQSRIGIWRRLRSQENGTTAKRRRVPFSNRGDSVSVLMESIAEDVVVENRNDQQELSESSKESKTFPFTHRRSVLSIRDLDLLVRAEKLLRVTTCEVMTSLVAGTIRKYCRQHGLLHPPDIGMVAPVNLKGHVHYDNFACSTVLVPMQLPTSIEGAIPRIWAVKSRFTNALRGNVVNNMSNCLRIARWCLPERVVKSLFRFFYRSTNVVVAFYPLAATNVSSDVSLKSVMFFPHFVPEVTSSFIFIERKNELLLCTTLCKATFPDSKEILSIFESETAHLLNHLSVRLLSLPQTTFLPRIPPPFSLQTQNEALSACTITVTEPSEEHEVESHTPHEYSIEELHELLATVQTQLDAIRANPQGDRGEYIRKLAALEEQMQAFHEIITKKIGTQPISAEMQRSADNECADAIAAVLAPYKDEAGGSTTQRRFSREFVRREQSASRKSSRTSTL